MAEDARIAEGKTLELGCGRNKHPDAVGIDRIRLPGVDVVHDLNRFPYPFPENTFSTVYATHVIEHLDSIIAVMEELHAQIGHFIEQQP